MAAAKKIKMLLVEREMTLTDLSKLLNKSLSTMSGKMARDNFSEKDLESRYKKSGSSRKDGI